MEDNVLKECKSVTGSGQMPVANVPDASIQQRHADGVRCVSSYPLPYDRNAVKKGIVHIGAGRFHRAHQALYCHELLAGGDFRWGISAVYILPSDQAIVSAMRKQQGVYSLVERDALGETAKVIGSIVEVLWGTESPESVFNRMISADTKLVTFTVTEAGYYFDAATKSLLLAHPAIINDLHMPGSPKTLYGYLATSLARRRAAGLPPFTIQSCDNIQGNGDLVRKLFLEFLVAYDQSHGTELHPWVDQRCAFPNSMVDRITPVAEQQEQSRIERLIGYTDAMAVTSESYRQWVVEDNYCNERPDWEAVGIQVVASVKTHEQIKIRLLNAGHSAVCYAGVLAGFDTIGDIVSTPAFQSYLRRFFAQTEKSLSNSCGVDLKTYQNKLIQRLTNPSIVDQALRICKDGSAKIPGFLVPTVQELIAQNEEVDTFAFIMACYALFLEKQLTEVGSSGIDDPKRECLAKLSMASKGCMKSFLSEQSLFGNLAGKPNFVAQVQTFADKIRSQGIRASLPI